MAQTDKPSLDLLPLRAWDDDDDELDRTFGPREHDYRELHREIKASSDVLDRLSSFLSSFQTDLTSVSGEIEDLQQRSLAIDRRGGGRRVIEKPLRALVDAITLPPPLVTLILDTPVSDAWFPAIEQLDAILTEIQRRTARVKAASEADRLGHALSVTAAQKIRAHLLALFKPLSTSVVANLPILQTSVLLRHRPLFLFLARRAPATAVEIKRSYVWRARSYHETAFRRYARAVGLVKARWTRPAELIGSSTISPTTPTITPAEEMETNLLDNSQIDGQGVVLAWQADNKNFNLPPEALFRSIMLVLLDNASAEFAFLVRFFGTSSASALPSRPTSPGFSSSPRLPWGIQAGSQSRLESDSGSMASFAAAEEGVTARSRLGGGSRSGPGPGLDKSEASELEGLWHQVFDPAITYCQSLITTLLTPPPSLPCHLAMIRLNDAVLAELESRGCTPLEAFVISQRLSLWPSFQKQMGLNLESLKKLADLAGAGSGLLGLAKSGGGVKDNLVAHVVKRYTSLFSSLGTLSSEADEAMLFGSLLRLRIELARLITAQASKIKDPQSRDLFKSTLIDDLRQQLRGTTHSARHAEEMEFWKGQRASG